MKYWIASTLKLSFVKESMMPTQNSGNWQLALDLLIARAALDSTLAQELLDNTITCCNANGVEIPAGINVVITKPNEEVLVKTIPGLQESSFAKSDSHKSLVGSTTFNESSQTTQTNTTQTAEAETTEVEAAETTTSVGAEAEAVVVIVAT